MNASMRVFVVRGICIIAVALAALYFPFSDFMLAGVVLGQGHFMLAYLYQAEAKKLPPRKLIILLGAFAFFTWLVFTLPPLWSVFVAAVAFLVHFAIDEVRLTTNRYSLFTALESAPFVLLYGALFADTLFGSSTFLWALCVAGVFLFALAALSFSKKRAPNLASYVAFAWILLTLVAYVLFKEVAHFNPLLLFWGIVLIHISIWYDAYYVRLKPLPAKEKEYLLRTALLNALLIVCAFLWMSGFSFFDTLFAPLFYYAWALLHIASSFRGNELPDSLVIS